MAVYAAQQCAARCHASRTRALLPLLNLGILGLSRSQPVPQTSPSYTVLSGLDWFKPSRDVMVRWFGLDWLHGVVGFAPDNKLIELQTHRFNGWSLQSSLVLSN
jgi:hypothetical protein